MGTSIFFILFFLFCIYISKATVVAPYNSSIIIRRNGNYLRTLKPGETTYINPLTDTWELSNKADFATNAVVTTSKKTDTLLHNAFKVAVPVSSSNGVNHTIYIRGSYTILSSTAPIKKVPNLIENVIATSVRAYYNNVEFSDSTLEFDKNELKILDLLRNRLENLNISLNSFEMSLSPKEAFDKIDCTHYDKNLPFSSYTSKNNKNTSTSSSDSEEVIRDLTTNISDNPIREATSITSVLHNTLDNMDCNVDPIDNKF